MTVDESTLVSYLPPGTFVRYDGLEQGGPEDGVVIHCWLGEDINAYDCYVAFFGNEELAGRPAEEPYILRYASTSLSVSRLSGD